MALHPVLEEKLNAALAPGQAAPKTQHKLPATLLVLTQEQAIALAGSGLRVMPAYEWMLVEISSKNSLTTAI